MFSVRCCRCSLFCDREFPFDETMLFVAQCLILVPSKIISPFRGSHKRIPTLLPVLRTQTLQYYLSARYADTESNNQTPLYIWFLPTVRLRLVAPLGYRSFSQIGSESRRGGLLQWLFAYRFRLGKPTVSKKLSPPAKFGSTPSPEKKKKKSNRSHRALRVRARQISKPG